MQAGRGQNIFETMTQSWDSSVTVTDGSTTVPQVRQQMNSAPACPGALQRHSGGYEMRRDVAGDLLRQVLPCPALPALPCLAAISLPEIRLPTPYLSAPLAGSTRFLFPAVTWPTKLLKKRKCKNDPRCRLGARVLTTCNWLLHYLSFLKTLT